MNYPSAETIETRLRIPRDLARRVRAILDGTETVERRPCETKMQAKLGAIDAILPDSFGVETIASAADCIMGFNGLTYCNRGETYAETVIFDHASGRYVIRSWGDIVERGGLRFAE